MGADRDGAIPPPTATEWFLVKGDRRLVAATVVLLTVVVVGVLVALDLVYVGPGGFVGNLFASGLTAGLITLLTLALSINQLVLSRIFGSPNEFADRLAGSRELRSTVESLTDEPASPIDPSEFLSLLARGLTDRAVALEDAIAAGEWHPPDDVTIAVRDAAEYGRRIDQRLTDRTHLIDALDVILGTAYAEQMVAVKHLRNRHGESLSRAALAELDALDDLLEALAVTRQFFKTMALQQDFARLSRLIITLGLVALFVAIAIALVYRSDATTVRPGLVEGLVTVGIAVVLAPLAAFVAYMARAATIAYRTVSVGPFVPPSE